MVSEVRWFYQAIPESGSHSDIGKYDTYGIQTVPPHAHIHDISTDRDFVEWMARRFTEYQLNPLHLADAVEDLLP